MRRAGASFTDSCRGASAQASGKEPRSKWRRAHKDNALSTGLTKSSDRSLVSQMPPALVCTHRSAPPSNPVPTSRAGRCEPGSGPLDRTGSRAVVAAAAAIQRSPRSLSCSRTWSLPCRPRFPVRHHLRQRVRLPQCIAALHLNALRTAARSLAGVERAASTYCLPARHARHKRSRAARSAGSLKVGAASNGGGVARSAAAARSTCTLRTAAHRSLPLFASDHAFPWRRSDAGDGPVRAGAFFV